MSEKQTLVQRAQRALRGEEPWEPIMERINSFVRGDLDAQLSALTEKLRAVEAERDEARRNLELYHEIVGLIERDLSIEPMSTTKTIGGELSALRAELERKDAALKAAERVCITQIEREDAIAAFEAVDGCMNDEMVRLGRANIAAREALASYRAALQPKEPPCQTA